MDEGEFVIATQNSSLLQDTDPLTPSLNDRFINCVVPNYTLQSITKISKALCGSKETAIIIAENYKRLLSRAEDVTPRTVFLASCGLRRRAVQ